ncbi:MAG TPA: diaminopimelate epimerase [Dehalococcoidia bacterium]|nr:diaminopimelate epimerase [Dehalococcoidia bacterium]
MKFTKMHGAGNDFLIVESSGEERDWPGIAQAMCHRNLGVGADGLMLLLPSDEADFRMRLFNADGSEAEVSGNGVRCLIKYAVERGIAAATNGRVTIEAIHDTLEAQVFMEGGKVARSRLSMGPPHFAPDEIPVRTDAGPPVLDFPINVNGSTIPVSCVSMGNPHAVVFLAEDPSNYPLEHVGPLVENHVAFPARVNFGAAYVASRERMDVRVWERGAGETLACGSGCCAAMVLAHVKGLVDNKVDVTQPGGLLTIEWNGRDDVYLTGPAEFVFDGDWPD